MISDQCFQDRDHVPCKSCDCYCHDLRDNKIDPRTDFFCPVCHEFYQDAISLLAHFYETPDFKEVASKIDKMFLDIFYDHEQAFVKLIFIISKLGLWDNLIRHETSFREIDFYTRPENKIYPHVQTKRWRFLENDIKN